MVYDFQTTCKTYDKNIYNRKYFEATPCPACPAIGRFVMHGSYSRYAIYFGDGKTMLRQVEIKRIKCVSCKTTHAVMPRDIIPYEILSIFVFVSVLVSFHLKDVPVLKISEKRGFSFQFIYSVMRAFRMHLDNVRQHIRETSPEDTPVVIDVAGVLARIKKNCAKFQCGYIGNNRRACFMCKFFDGRGAPPVGIVAPRGATT